MADRSIPPDPERRVARREVLVGLGALALAGCAKAATDAGAPGTSTSSSTSSSTSVDSRPAGSAPGSTTATTAVTTVAPEACILSPELTAGPYHLDGHLNRRDITEGRPGTPLELRIRVLAIDGCGPLAGAAVDVWHCDAGGEYSGFNGNSLAATQAGGTNDKRHLRGVQLTDDDGLATFTTIFPGWYEGRAVHIHLQVMEGGALTAAYAGGHVAHVGQVFFDEPTTAQILAGDPYRAHTGTRTTNDQDSIFRQAGAGAIAALTAAPTGALTADFTCIVDPAATPPPAPLF